MKKKLSISTPVWPAAALPSLAAFHIQHQQTRKSCFPTHFDVEEPGFEGIHLAGSSAQVVHHQVQGPGGQEVGVRATELLPACREREAETGLGAQISTKNLFFDCVT